MEARKMSPLGILIWISVAILGASAVGGIALHRGESINSVWFIIAAVCVYAIGYRFYSAFIAATVLMLDATAPPPPNASTMAVTLCPPTNGGCSATTLPPLPGRTPTRLLTSLG